MKACRKASQVRRNKANSRAIGYDVSRFLQGRSVIPHNFSAGLVLSILFLAELVRKYIYPSTEVLAIGEAALVLIALFYAPVWLAAGIRRLLSLALASISWSLVSVMTGHQDLALAAVGVRGVAMPFVGLLVGVSICRRLGSQRFSGLLYSFAGFWLCVIGAVALAQVWLGRDHWLNYVPPELFADERMGIGDYTAGELGVDWLFRPTSIFLHTGKFGLVAFVLASYRAFHRAEASVSVRQWVFSTFWEAAVLVLSGQRAATLFYLAGLSVVAIWLSRAQLKVRLTGAAAIVAIGGLVAVGLQAEDPGARVVAARLWSGLLEVSVRAENNLWVPFSFVVSKWLFKGEGAGAFSFGSVRFGGRPLYEVVPVGSAENSWLRRIAEEGILGALLSAALLLSVAVMALRRARDERGYPQAGGFYWVPFEMAAMALWANTHDVLGNTITMFLVFAFSGSIGAPRIPRGVLDDHSSRPRHLHRSLRARI